MGHYVSALLNDYDLNFDASFEAMERAYAAAPNQPFFAIRRGFYHFALGYISAGASMIEAGVRMDPTDALGLLNLGQAKIYLGEFTLAWPCLSAASLSALRLQTSSDASTWAPRDGQRNPINAGNNSRRSSKRDTPQGLRGQTYGTIWDVFMRLPIRLLFSGFARSLSK